MYIRGTACHLITYIRGAGVILRDSVNELPFTIIIREDNTLIQTQGKYPSKWKIWKPIINDEEKNPTPTYGSEPSQLEKSNKPRKMS